MQGRAASLANLPTTHDKIKQFMARRRLRVAQKSVRAVVRLLSFRRKVASAFGPPAAVAE